MSNIRMFFKTGLFKDLPVSVFQDIFQGSYMITEVLKKMATECDYVCYYK
jgi:hypothetical protein